MYGFGHYLLMNLRAYETAMVEITSTMVRTRLAMDELPRRYGGDGRRRHKGLRGSLGMHGTKRIVHIRFVKIRLEAHVICSITQGENMANVLNKTTKVYDAGR